MLSVVSFGSRIGGSYFSEQLKLSNMSSQIFKHAVRFHIFLLNESVYDHRRPAVASGFQPRGLPKITRIFSTLNTNLSVWRKTKKLRFSNMCVCVRWYFTARSSGLAERPCVQKNVETANVCNELPFLVFASHLANTGRFETWGLPAMIKYVWHNLCESDLLILI